MPHASESEVQHLRERTLVRLSNRVSTMRGGS
jgi:hypothetical protein